MKIKRSELQELVALGHWYGMRQYPCPVVCRSNYKTVLNWFLDLDLEDYINKMTTTSIPINTEEEEEHYTLNYDNPQVQEWIESVEEPSTNNEDYKVTSEPFVLNDDAVFCTGLSTPEATSEVAQTESATLEVEPQSINPTLDRIDTALRNKDVAWFLDEFNAYSVFYNCSKEKVEEIGRMLTPYVVETYGEIFNHPIKGSDVIKILQDFPYFKVVRELYRSLPIMLYKCFKFMVYDNEWDKELFVILHSTETKEQQQFLKDNDYYIADAIQAYFRSTNDFVELPE